MKNKHLVYSIISVIVIVLVIYSFQHQQATNMTDITSMAVSTTIGNHTESQIRTFAITSGHCKASDPTWCCEEPGYVVCGDTDVCGPSEDFCYNFLYNPQSCFLNKSRCCPIKNNVLDYSSGVCCGSDNPYYIGVWENIARCGKFPNVYSNNYYTSQSDCKAWRNGNTCGSCGGPTNDIVGCAYSSCGNNPSAFFSQNECRGTDFWSCLEDSYLVFNFANQGKIIGKCGVECNLAEKEYYDCGSTYLKKWEKRTCDNYKWFTLTYPNVPSLKPCSCADNSVCQSGNECVGNVCVPHLCNSGVRKCVENKTFVCINNKFEQEQDCEYGCSNGKCVTWFEKYWVELLASLIAVFFLIGIFMLKKFQNTIKNLLKRIKKQIKFS